MYRARARACVYEPVKLEFKLFMYGTNKKTLFAFLLLASLQNLKKNTERDVVSFFIRRICPTSTGEYFLREILRGRIRLENAFHLI